VAIVVTVGAGFPIILHEVERNLQIIGIFLAICGHIYISAAVSVASMTYYRERYERIESQLVRER
jgi:hypothetical protein